MQFKVTLLISSLLLGAASASPLKMAAGNAGNTKSHNSLLQRTDFNCDDKTDGYYRDVDDCTKYYACVGAIKYVMDCPPTLYYNLKMIQCDYPANVAECTTTPA